MTSFEGFPKGGVDFFRALTLNQDREWFKAHKADYEQLWHAPITALIETVHARVKPLFPESKATKPKVFRVYRDVRFSKDKTPYKTYAAAMVPLFSGAGTPEGSTGFYCEFGLDGAFAAAGRWAMEGDVLQRYRKTVADEKTGAPFAAEVKRLEKAGFELSSLGKLTRVPPAFDKQHPRAELLRHKGCAFAFPKIPEKDWRNGKKLTDGLLASLTTLAPTLRWVDAVARGKRPVPPRAR
ncbi:MAG: DUF2461 domain-containing protein [Archangium sp.]|nr:DUF2461 domain-containing protein [Archangium sp.]